MNWWDAPLSPTEKLVMAAQAQFPGASAAQIVRVTGLGRSSVYRAIEAIAAARDAASICDSSVRHAYTSKMSQPSQASHCGTNGTTVPLPPSPLSVPLLPPHTPLSTPPLSPLPPLPSHIRAMRVQHEPTEDSPAKPEPTETDMTPRKTSPETAPQAGATASDGHGPTPDQPPKPFPLQRRSTGRNYSLLSDFQRAAFDDVWEFYPKRNGIKSGKDEAAREFRVIFDREADAHKTVLRIMDFIRFMKPKWGRMPPDLRRVLCRRMWETEDWPGNPDAAPDPGGKDDLPW